MKARYIRNKILHLDRWFQGGGGHISLLVRVPMMRVCIKQFFFIFRIFFACRLFINIKFMKIRI